MTTAYSYIRFSSRAQASGASLARQMEAAERYCYENELTLDTSLSLHDLGVSGYTGDNAEAGALAGFLKAIDDEVVTPGSILLVENIDRISRQEPLEAFDIIRLIIKAGVSITTLMDRQTYTRKSLNSGGQAFVLWALMQRAYEESKCKSERVRDAWKRKKRAMIEHRKPMTAHAPKWLKLSDDRTHFEPIPEKLAVIDRVFQMCVDGVGVGTIAQRLNTDGVPTMSGKGIWRCSAVSALIRNRALLGEHQQEMGRGKDRHPVGDPIAGYFPAVVSKSKFFAAQDAMATRRQHRGRNGKRVHLFSGMVTSMDGTSWVLSHSGARKQYLIESTRLNGVPGHQHVPLRIEPFEAGLCLMVRQLWERQSTPSDNTAKIDLLLGEIADHDARLMALRDKIKRSDPRSVGTLIEMVPEVEDSRHQLQSDLDQLQAKASRRPNHLPSLIDELESDVDDNDVRLKVRQVIRESVQGVRVVKVERINGKPTGTRVVVEMTMTTGELMVAMMVWQRGYRCNIPDVAIRPLLSTGDEPLAHLGDEFEPVDADQDVMLLQIKG